MSDAKRRDNKGRVLRTGESQRKDGCYAYKYYTRGKAHFAYSWKLVKTDKTPTGKKNDLSLREKESLIQKDLEDGIEINNTTVIELVDKYLQYKSNKNPKTIDEYKRVRAIIANSNIAYKKIKNLKLSDAKLWLANIKKLNGEPYSYSYLNTIKSVMNPAFKMAVKDDLIRKSPFDFKIKEIRDNNGKTKDALSKEQEQKFLDFVKQDKKSINYYEDLYILFHTGLRISEYGGLTVKDIDMQKGCIDVNHQYVNRNIGIAPPKYNSYRKIYFGEEVRACLEKKIKNTKQRDVDCIIDGYSRFLNLDKKNKPRSNDNWYKIFSDITKRYNLKYPDENLVFSPHVCRHTFCTNLMKNGVNIKVVQNIMGHSDIQTTLNIYTHINDGFVEDELKKYAQ